MFAPHLHSGSQTFYYTKCVIQLRMIRQPAVTELELEKASEETDEELVDRARRGDGQALSRLLGRYRHQAVRAAYGMLHSAEDAEDVAQEAFVRVFQALPAYRGEGKFFTWLYRMIINLCAGRRRSPTSREIATGDVEPAEAMGVTEETAIGGMAVRDVMARLPAQQRAVLVLRELERLPYADIAEIMGIAVGTVKYHICEARRSFRRIWMEEMGDEM